MRVTQSFGDLFLIIIMSTSFGKFIKVNICWLAVWWWAVATDLTLKYVGRISRVFATKEKTLYVAEKVWIIVGAFFFPLTPPLNLVSRHVFKEETTLVVVRSLLRPQHCLMQQKRFSKASWLTSLHFKTLMPLFLQLDPQSTVTWNLLFQSLMQDSMDHYVVELISTASFTYILYLLWGFKCFSEVFNILHESSSSLKVC